MFNFYNFKITVFYKVPYSKENNQIMKQWRMLWNPDKKLWSKTIHYNGLEDQIFIGDNCLPVFEFEAVDVQCDIPEHKDTVYKQIENNKIKYMVNKKKKEQEDIEDKEYLEQFNNEQPDTIENFVVYYKDMYNEYRTYNYHEKTYNTIITKPIGINNYYMFDKYNLSAKEIKDKQMTNEQIQMELDLRLSRYCDDLVIWAEELDNCSSLKVPFNPLSAYVRINGTRYYRNNYQIIFLFYSLYGSRKELFDKLNKCKITRGEYEFFENCNNGGLTYLIEKNYINDCFGYDFSLNYPNLMASKDFHIPTKEGVEMILETLPKKLKYGIYKVKFNMSTIPNEMKIVFKFMKSNCYTHYELNYIRKTFKDVQFELIQDGTTNALVYEDKDLITGSELFFPWLQRIKELRAELPNNFLVKHLGSKLWGVLTEWDAIYMPEDKLEENGVEFREPNSTHVLLDCKVKKNGELHYKLAKHGSYYKKNIRIKPFLTSYARVNISKVAMSNINHIVRIQTDGVVFDEPLSKDILNKFPNLKPEDKTTGCINWKNLNDYWKV